MDGQVTTRSEISPELRDAHAHCSRHRLEIESSELCGCFYCGKMFLPSEITHWIDNDQTAMCPYCDIDSVLGSASGLPISKEFFDRMNEVWFA